MTSHLVPRENLPDIPTIAQHVRADLSGDPDAGFLDLVTTLADLTHDDLVALIYYLETGDMS